MTLVCVLSIINIILLNVISFLYFYYSKKNESLKNHIILFLLSLTCLILSIIPIYLTTKYTFSFSNLFIILNIIVSVIVGIFCINELAFFSVYSNKIAKSVYNIKTEQESDKNIYYYKPRWEELSNDIKNQYIEKAIKELYIKQLEDPYYEIDIDDIADKRMAIKTNVFIYDSLNENEKRIVDRIAKNKYISPFDQTKKVESKKGLSKLAKAMIIIPIIWIVLFLAFLFLFPALINVNPSIAAISLYLSIFVYSLGGAVGLFEFIGMIILIVRHVKKVENHFGIY